MDSTWKRKGIYTSIQFTIFCGNSIIRQNEEKVRDFCTYFYFYVVYALWEFFPSLIVDIRRVHNSKNRISIPLIKGNLYLLQIYKNFYKNDCRE